MTEATLEWRNYKYFPYERDFARMEVKQLFGTAMSERGSRAFIPARFYQPSQAERLTYFARAVPPLGDAVIPRQARLEASASNNSSDRQATRYSAHGLHEYKGKFNPQVVRAIGNILGLRDDAFVLDPFCGSGTTLLECAHAGWNAMGIDRNPLAVRISTAKLRALRNADKLAKLGDALAKAIEPYGHLSSDLSVSPARLRAALGEDWQLELTAFEYLREWFPLPVLAQSVVIRRAVSRVVSPKSDQRVFEVILSDQLREASLQEPKDLRIRLRKDAAPNYPLLEMFCKAVDDRLARTQRARAALGAIGGSQTAVLADNRAIGLTRHFPRNGVDAVITSPPYETALPYVDTQRLSLVFLGDIRADQISETEKQLIGAREIAVRERRGLENEIVGSDPTLPNVVIALCRELLAASRGPNDGFRKRNRPALTFRYFKQMSLFFVNLRNAVRPGGKVALVVGPSRTTLSGTEFVIDTPQLLLALAEHHGYRALMNQPMDTYQRYDLHQQNSIESERLIVLERP